MSRMHKPDPKLGPYQQDKRSVIAIESEDVERWLNGPVDQVTDLLRPPAIDLIDAGINLGAAN